MPRAFANLVYASAWIKCHYPDVFLAALLNSQPMGFYATSQLVRDAQEHGVEVRSVDVNHSDWDCSLESSPAPQGNLHQRHSSMSGDILTTHAVRLGLRQIDGFSEEWGKNIESTPRPRLQLRPRPLATHRSAAKGAAKARPR